MTESIPVIPEPKPASSSDDIKKAAYSLSYGVYVITTANNNHRAGMTAVWVCQMSKSPIRLGIGITPEAFTTGQILQNQQFCVNILPDSMKEIAYRFGSSSGSMEDKFSNLNVSESPGQQPILSDSLAWIECRVESVQDLGTHLWITGVAVEAGTGTGNPAIYHNGQINGFQSL